MSLAFFVIACGGSERLPVERRVRARTSVLAGIAGRAGECTWVDGAQLSAQERLLLARLTPLHPIAFHPNVREYARCLVETSRGVEEVTAVHFVGAHERATFAPPDARWASDQLTWSEPARDLAVGVDVRSAMALAMAARTQPLQVTATSPGGTTLVIRTAWARAERGVVIQTDYRGAIPDVPAEDLTVAVGMLLMMAEGAHETFGPRTRRQSLGQPLTLSWTMLALEANDADLAQRARVYAGDLMPLANIDPARVDLIRAEALRHCAEARRAEGALRIERATTCAAFYTYLYTREERVSDAVLAVAAHREAGALVEARTLAEAAYAQAPSDPRTHSIWLENAGPELSAAFSQMHPEVSARDRQRFLDSAPTYLAEGLSGLTLEASFLASIALAQTPPMRVAPVTLPPDALADLAYVLLLAEGAQGPLTVRLEGALRADAPTVSLGVGARWTLAEAVRSGLPSREIVWAASIAEPTFQAVRTLSQAVQAQLATTGLVRLVVRLGATELVWSMNLERGRVQLLADTSRRDWPSLARNVAFPLAQLPATRFPPPTLSLTLPSETLDALLPMLSTIVGVHCTSAAQIQEGLGAPPRPLHGLTSHPQTLDCTLRERGPEALLQVLVELTRILEP